MLTCISFVTLLQFFYHQTKVQEDRSLGFYVIRNAFWKAGLKITSYSLSDSNLQYEYEVIFLLNIANLTQLDP